MKEGRVLSPEEIVAIFKRFPEGNPYYIPLFLAYAYGMEKDEAFAITVNDVRDSSYIITTRKVSITDLIISIIFQKQEIAMVII